MFCTYTPISAAHVEVLPKRLAHPVDKRLAIAVCLSVLTETKVGVYYLLYPDAVKHIQPSVLFHHPKVTCASLLEPRKCPVTQIQPAGLDVGSYEQYAVADWLQVAFILVQCQAELVTKKRLQLWYAIQQETLIVAYKDEIIHKLSHRIVLASK